MAITELAWWHSAKEYQANTSLINHAMDLLRQANALKWACNGLQLEDKTTAYVINVWESLNAHHQFMKDKVPYDALVEALKPSFGGDITVLHYALEGDVIKALTSPTTGFILFTVKPDKLGAKPELASLLGTVSKDLNSHGGTVVWGPGVEKGDEYLIVIGRDSATPELHISNIEAISNLAEHKVWHVQLHK